MADFLYGVFWDGTYRRYEITKTRARSVYFIDGMEYQISRASLAKGYTCRCISTAGNACVWFGRPAQPGHVLCVSEDEVVRYCSSTEFAMRARLYYLTWPGERSRHAGPKSVLAASWSPQMIECFLAYRPRQGGQGKGGI